MAIGKAQAEVEITAANRMQKAFDSAQRQLKGLDRTVQLATRAFAGLSVVAAGREFVQMADRAQTLENRLKLVTDSTAQLNTVQEQLFNLSQDTRSSFEGTVELYARVARATGELGISQSRLLGVTQTINQAIQVSGATSVEAEAALIQLSQGLAAGALRGEELNSVLEQTPRLAQAIADGMGITIGQLRQAGKEGQLTAETVITAIERQAGTINAEFSQMEGTVGQAVTNLGNSFLNLVGKLDNATGASQTLAKAIRGVSIALDEAAELAGKDFSTGIAEVDLAIERTALAALQNANPAAAAIINLGRAFAAMGDDAEEAGEKTVTALQEGAAAYQRFLATIAGGNQQPAQLEQVAITAAKREVMRSMPEFDPIGGQSEAQAERAKELEAQALREIEQLRQFTMTREQVELEAHARRMEILRTRFEEGYLLEEEFHRLSIDLANQTQERITRITEQGLSEREKFTQMSSQAQAAHVLDSLVQMTAGVASTNKTMFKLNKAAAIASAIVNTAQGVTKALAAYPPPISFIMAAAQAAAGAAQIQAIKATSFGGGTTPSLAGSTGQVNGQPVQSLPDLSRQTERDSGRGRVIVEINGNNFYGPNGAEEFARLVTDVITSEVNDRDVQIIHSDSRQAATIRGS